MTTVVSTRPLRDLVSRLGGATPSDVNAIIAAVSQAASLLRDSIDDVPFYEGAFSDDPVPADREIQKKALSDAIDKLVNASSLADKKSALIYLESTIAVSEAFFQQQPAWNSFRDTLEQALATIAGAAGSAVAVSLAAFMKKAWVVLLVVAVLLVGLVYLKGR